MFQNCIRCTVCVENCPVFAVNPLFPGPKQAGPDAQRFRLDGEAVVDDWVKYCCQCRRCQTACPYGVPCADIILRAQMKHEEVKSFSRQMFARVHTLGRISSSLAPLVNFLMRRERVKSLMRKLGVSTSIPFPSYRFRTLERSWKNVGLLTGRKEKKVALFHGCFMNFNQPEIGRKIRNLLSILGYEVTIPPQTCCGLPALGNYDEERARKYAQKNLDCLIPYVDAGYDILYTCTSCGLTITHDYQKILQVSGGKKVAENTYYLYDYLLNTLSKEAITSLLGEVDLKVTYHIPCHLKALGIGYPFREILASIPGLDLSIQDEYCCGLAGSYGFKRENEETARLIGEKAARRIEETQANVIVSDCGACRMQLSHLTGCEAVDPADILEKSLLARGMKLKLSYFFLGSHRVGISV
ncbi:MAG: anaerobic glycerol-3-phosphate dehydrogenase subunit C [Syntrophales bacterium]|nr:anaerobic glycerol-3-phosphate dehydrogenase subunit C [Syntrophales bacterium]